MKIRLVILFCLFSIVVLSQKKVVKKFQITATEIEISTLGLDDFVIENSESNFVEVYLFAENSGKQHIIYNEAYNLVKVQFNIPNNKLEEKVFRKFITERLHRASAIIKVPKNKVITIYGDEINVESKNYEGDLNFFIEKGILKLHKVFANLVVKMYAGNLYASLKKANISVVSKTGKIKINNIFVKKKYQKKDNESNIEVSINSLKANIFLTTK